MVFFYLYLLATIGLTNILVHGRILDMIKLFGKSVREWMHYFKWSEELFTCPECTGFWSGMICCLLLLTGDWYYVVGAGFAGSFLSSFATDITYLINSKIEFEVDTDANKD